MGLEYSLCNMLMVRELRDLPGMKLAVEAALFLQTTSFCTCKVSTTITKYKISNLCMKLHVSRDCCITIASPCRRTSPCRGNFNTAKEKK